MTYLAAYLLAVLHVLCDTAPWLLLGLLFAGLLKVFVAPAKMARWLGGRGLWPITKAALIGAPLPLCSCGVLPAALGLRRQGASKGATAAFLIATPETGVDSLLLSYALLGPVMMVARPVAAVATAIVSGVLVNAASETAGANGAESLAQPGGPAKPTAPGTACKGGSCCCTGHDPVALHDPVARPLWQKLAAGVHYAMTDILDDLAVWLAVGILVAAAVNVFVPPATLERWGSGLPAMVLILLVGLPMYICATASTPLGAAMLAAGVSPGTVLVFLLAGPATNFAGMAVVRRELGTRGLVAYLVGISASAIGAGLALDGLSRGWGSAAWASGSAAGGELLPAWLSMAAAMVVVACAVRPLRRSLATRLARLLARTSPAASA